MMEVGVVMPVGPGRLENVLAVLGSLAEQTVKPRVVICVADGPDAAFEIAGATSLPFPTAVLNVPEKHKPGMEQPRNLGVRLLRDLEKQDPRFGGITHVWFVDSDVIMAPDCLEMYQQAMQQEPIDRVLIGPYDWNPEGLREPLPDLRNDPRWGGFDTYSPFEILRGDLSAGLACFSGNLVWPIEEFERVGGFWNEIHHGRCEDGELGLRAVAMGVPISYVKDARGWHLWHPINLEWAKAANSRDVPMLNARHPWVQGEGLFVVEEDGKRFDTTCPNCSQQMNTAEIWAHLGQCPMKDKDPEDESIFPMPAMDPKLEEGAE